MGAQTKIEWCNHTFNPWIGCTKIDDLCTNCYAESDDKWRGWTPAGWGKGKPRHRTTADYWKGPLKWDVAAAAHRWGKCQACGKAWAFGAREEAKMTCGDSCGGELVEQRPRVFSASLADVWDEEVCAEWRADFLRLVMQTRHLDWLLLSKRPGLWRKLVTEARDWQAQAGRYHPRDAWFIEALTAWLDGTPPDNVWIGTSIGTRAGYEARMAEFLCIPARVHFLSMEPLLEAVPFERVGITPSISFDPLAPVRHGLQTARVDWVIAGGESGPKARPMHPQWAREIRDACQKAGVPFLFKQWGEWIDTEQADASGLDRSSGFAKYGFLEPDGHFEGQHGDGTSSVAMVYRVGKLKAGRLLDGVEHNGFPVVKGGRA
jgi:protein gp37